MRYTSHIDTAGVIVSFCLTVARMETSHSQEVTIDTQAWRGRDPLLCHRLGKKRYDRDRPIIVRFGSDRLRDQVIRSRSKLKTSADRRDTKPIYVNEDLSAYRAKLAFDARQLKKKGRVADTWTFNGKIVVKDKRNNISEIASADDLVRFQ